MNTLPLLCVVLLAAPSIPFERRQIASFPAGYQVAVADMNADGKPDVVALSTEANQVDWFENPGWQQRPIARTARPIDLAIRDIDGDRQGEIALASGFYFSESARGGQIDILTRPSQAGALWTSRPIAVDPVTHRLRWGDLDGDGRPELVHAPLFGPGSRGAEAPTPAHLWAFRPPKDLSAGKWDTVKINESLTVLHGLYVGDRDGDGRDETLTASFEGVFSFRAVRDASGAQASTVTWEKTKIGSGALPASNQPGAARGSSEIAPGSLGPGWPFLAAIEPWHGHQVVVYMPGAAGALWRRQVIDESLRAGHALVVADFDGDGADEIVAGWRGEGGGLILLDAGGADWQRPSKLEIDQRVPAEGAAVADMNGDGKLDLVIVAGQTNQLLWYRNLWQ